MIRRAPVALVVVWAVACATPPVNRALERIGVT